MYPAPYVPEAEGKRLPDILNMIDRQRFVDEAVQAASRAFVRARPSQRGRSERTGRSAAFHGFLGMICARSGDSVPSTKPSRTGLIDPATADYYDSPALISLADDQERAADAHRAATAELCGKDERLLVAGFAEFDLAEAGRFCAAGRGP